MEKQRQEEQKKAEDEKQRQKEQKKAEDEKQRQKEQKKNPSEQTGTGSAPSPAAVKQIIRLEKQKNTVQRQINRWEKSNPRILNLFYHISYARLFMYAAFWHYRLRQRFTTDLRCRGRHLCRLRAALAVMGNSSEKAARQPASAVVFTVGTD